MVEGGRRGLHAVGVPDGRAGFDRRLPGTPLAAAWAPAGIRIAYVVRAPGGDRLYDMFGNGTHAVLVAAHALPQAPTWRWDSQAFAYIRADGAVMIHNVIDGATSPLPPGCGLHHAAAVAFAPYGGLLAIADRAGRVRVLDTLRHGHGTCVTAGGAGTPKIAWLEPRQRSRATSPASPAPTSPRCPAAWPGSPRLPAAAGSRSRCAMPRERCA
jgi:hypothetical protein